MPTVETVNGPVDVEDLGLTLIHEHFRATDEAGRMQFPHLYDEQGEWEAAISDANAVKGHGVQTVVEPSAMFLNRDAAERARNERRPAGSDDVREPQALAGFRLSAGVLTFCGGF
jgi:predicted metal-dependent phosphotriesterase family hydrolase